MGCHLQPLILQTFSPKLQRCFLLQVESTEALLLALNKSQGAVCRILASASRPMPMEWCSICFLFPARAGIGSTFPQSHTQRKSLSYMLPPKLRWSEFLQTMGQLPTKWVGDKGQPPHWLSLLSLVPPRDESQGQVRQLDIQLFRKLTALAWLLFLMFALPCFALCNIHPCTYSTSGDCWPTSPPGACCSVPSAYPAPAPFQWHDSTHLW